MADDGATIEQKKLASDSGVTAAVAVTMTGADLELARMKREAGTTDGTLSGANLAQRANRARIISAGESSYAAAGGKVTRIIGEGFTGATSVTAGGTAFTAFSVVNDEVIQATTPAKAAASYDLVVVHADGNATVTNGITYV